jgi:hypothetical protein
MVWSPQTPPLRASARPVTLCQAGLEPINAVSRRPWPPRINDSRTKPTRFPFMTRLRRRPLFPAKQHRVFCTAQWSPAHHISLVKTIEHVWKGPGTMRKSLATSLLFVAVIAASAVLAIARTTHSPAEPASPRPAAAAKSAQIKGTVQIERPVVRPRSPFETCQHQDPSTPAVRTGTSGCFPLPY